MAFGLAAQVDIKPGIGVNFSSLSKDPESGEVSAQVGWQLGGTVLFGSKFYGEAGAFYLQRSTEFSSETVEELNFDSKISGISVPLTVGFHLLGSRTSSFALRIFGGGSAYFVTKVSGGGITKDDIASPQWGVFAGAGLDIWLLYLDLRYEWSVTDHADDNSFDIGKMRGFYATVGMRF